MSTKRTIKTVWEFATYDVWGNAKDGYQVNDTYRSSRELEIRAQVKVNNEGKPGQFESAHLTDYQIRQVFGCGRVRLDVQGDDLTYYVNRERDGYPIGELHCVSHESLSPIREAKEQA